MNYHLRLGNRQLETVSRVAKNSERQTFPDGPFEGFDLYKLERTIPNHAIYLLQLITRNEMLEVSERCKRWHMS